MSTIKHIIRGCGTLPNCGEHPGTIWLVFFVLVGVAAGVGGDLTGCIGGGAIMAVIFGPIYLIGAYERSKSDRTQPTPPESKI